MDTAGSQDNSTCVDMTAQTLSRKQSSCQVKLLPRWEWIKATDVEEGRAAPLLPHVSLLSIRHNLVWMASSTSPTLCSLTASPSPTLCMAASPCHSAWNHLHHPHSAALQQSRHHLSKSQKARPSAHSAAIPLRVRVRVTQLYPPARAVEL
jgi:hypothetical protein